MTDNEHLRQLEDKLWKAADQLRANSSLAASQYSVPVLGLIFLRYADVRFSQLEKQFAEPATGRREIGKADYQARGVMYVPETARFSYLKSLPEGSDVGAALNRARLRRGKGFEKLPMERCRRRRRGRRGDRRGEPGSPAPPASCPHR